MARKNLLDEKFQLMFGRNSETISRAESVLHLKNSFSGKLGKPQQIATKTFLFIVDEALKNRNKYFKYFVPLLK